MANIDSSEIKRQADRIDQQLQMFITKTSDIIGNLGEASSVIKSEDSALSNEVMQYQQTYSTLQQKISQSFQSLSKIMHNYVNKSLNNEETTSRNVQSANSELESINQLIGSIDSSTHKVRLNPDPNIYY